MWKTLDAAGLASSILDLIRDIIACPGLDYCSLANARSIPIAQKIATRFADPERQRDLGELKLTISGSIHACGHHDRKSAVRGNSVSVRVSLGGRRFIKNK